MKYHKKIQERGITLIALVVTIIILLILIGVTLFQLSGEKGMFEIAKNARKQYEIEKYIEEIEIARGDIQVEKRRTETLDELVQKIKDDKIIEGGTISKVDEETAKAVTKEGYILTIKSGKVSTYEGNNNIKQTGLIGEIQEIKESGIQTVEVEGTVENKRYSLDVIVHNGDLILDGEKEVEGATLANKVYEFGEVGDVATASENAKNMVVLKVNGDITIKEGVTLTSVKSSSNYGGPKGMTIYCTGTLTNDGTISMTARGAKAEGENVYLWENTDGTFEYVPAIGGAGGQGFSIYYKTGSNGRNGTNGVGRQTGGGGTGAAQSWVKRAGVGNGSAGTSYSGGSGSGGSAADGEQSGNGESYSGNASGNGGAGSNGSVHSASTEAGQIAMGGTGNPSGGYQNYRENVLNYIYRSGTGGLLNICSNIIINNGVISSEGVTSSSATLSNRSGWVCPGGSSGGGSINIFYFVFIKKGVINTKGGYSLSGDGRGYLRRSRRKWNKYMWKYFIWKI